MISSLTTSWRIPPPFPRMWSLAPPMPLPLSSTPSPPRCPSGDTMPRVSLHIPHHASQHHRWVAAVYTMGRSDYDIDAIWCCLEHVWIPSIVWERVYLQCDEYILLILPSSLLPFLSQHRLSSIDFCNLSPSSASGPPLSHRVGSRKYSITPASVPII